MKNLNSGGNKSGKLTEKEFNKMCKKSFKQFNHTITAFNSKGEPIPKSKLSNRGTKSGKIRRESLIVDLANVPEPEGKYLMISRGEAKEVVKITKVVYRPDKLARIEVQRL